jgi:protein-disulfide isomerase
MNPIMRVLTVLFAAPMLVFAATGCESLMVLLFGVGVEETVMVPEETRPVYEMNANFRLADGGFVLGTPNAPITIVVFADFLCPHCQRYEPTIEQVIQEYVPLGMARVEFRMLPTQGEASNDLFRLAECIDDYDKTNFWMAQRLIYDLIAEGVSASDIGVEAALSLKISYKNLRACVDNLAEHNAGQYLADSEVSRSLGVSGAPTIMMRFGGPEAPIESSSNTQPSFEDLSDIILAANAPGV